MSASAGTHDGESAHPDLQRLADELRQATLNVVWRQWRALGAGAAAPSARTRGGAGRELHALVDPEALVLISLSLLPYERRLADLLHDWAARNADLLSVQRMKNLEAGYAESVRPLLAGRLAWFAGVARDEGRDLRWRSVAQTWTEQSRITDDDSTIADALSVRPGAGAGGKSRATRVRPTTGASLLLRLRLGFGVGVKADLLGFLLARGGERATIRTIARATAYTPAAIRRAADDLAAAQLIEATDAQPASYRVAVASWASLLALDGPPPRWASWHERFAFVAEFLHWAETARERPLGRYAFGVHGRELLERHRSAFEQDELAVWSAHSPITDWAAFVQQAVRSLVGWMEEQRKEGVTRNDAELATELDRRLAEHEADPGAAVPWEQVRRDLLDR